MSSKTESTVIQRYIKGYLTFVFVLIMVEIAGIVYTQIALFGDRHYICYLLLRIALLVINIITFGLLIFHLKNTEYNKQALMLVYIYTTLILIICMVISALDVAHTHEGHQGFPIVFLTAVMAVGCLTPIRHWYYGLEVCSLSAILVVIDHQYNPEYTFSLIMGEAIFVLLALFIEHRNYRISMDQYKRSLSLEVLSYYDQLTGVFNRRSLDERLAAVEKKEGTYRLAIIDIDDFKQVNDAEGHLIGDELIKRVADSLKKNFPDPVYRYGGDEFVVLSKMNVDDMLIKISNINEQFKGANIHISAGIASTENHIKLIDTLKNADYALYKAKKDGKGKAVVFEYDK